MGKLIEPRYGKTKWPPGAGMISVERAARQLGLDPDILQTLIGQGRLQVPAVIREPHRVIYFLDADIIDKMDADMHQQQPQAVAL